ncbi:DUF5590 domain-containing protein [Salipaludibacillus aurantiacus]|uniref:Uncharacterized protein YpmB n=1 Tax=Salipaludibacillus aurantiacus TaxID=1601833 RepID=A0A1H9P5H3_9BACI|nr:DUF5590 domain-containing protein [Salipaludibacillus aurantiacus]SER43337.1 Uncharacterized protein YpmB [Salipaludibacillus aurantiacus]
MKAWIISISAVFIIGFIAFSSYIYYVTAEPLREREEAAVQLASEHVSLSEVRDIQYYHGRRSYQVIDAVNEDGEDIYIWVEEDEDRDEVNIEVRLHSEGLTKEEVMEIAVSELEIQSIKSVRLGMTGSTPVYEVSYMDQVDRHSFYYLTFEDGTYIRHYQFLS